MKKLSCFAFVGLFVCGMLPFVGQAFADEAKKVDTKKVEVQKVIAKQTMPAPIIGIVDVDAVEGHSKAMLSLRKQFEIQGKAYGTELKKKQDKLGIEYKALEKKRSTLSKEDFAKEQKAFVEKTRQLEKEAAEFKKALTIAYIKGKRSIRQSMRKVMLKIGEERHINLVLNASRAPVFFAVKSLVLDDIALKSLDKALPTLKLDVQAPKK